MSLTKRVSLLIIALVVIGGIHFSGIYLQLYWRTPLFDIFLHLLGGAWIGWIVLTLLQYNVVAITTKKNAYVAGISVVIIVGILWEIFEVIIGFSIIDDPLFMTDTVIDLIADIIGAGLVMSLWKKQQ